MVLNFSGSSSDDSRKAVTAPEALIANSTTQDSDAADGDTSGSLAIPSVIATGTADSRASTAVPPDATATRGTAEGSVGGVPSVAAVGFDGGGGSLAPGATSQTIPQTGEGGSEVVPSVPPPAATGLIDKNEAGSPRVNATEAPVIRSWQTDQAAPEAAPAAAQSDGGGVDILVLVAIVLATGVVLAFAGSVLIPRIARDDQ